METYFFLPTFVFSFLYWFLFWITVVYSNPKMASSSRHVVTMENGQKVIVEREGPGNLEEILEDVVYEETVGEMGDVRIF